MADVSKYQALVIPEHAKAPKFLALITALTQCFVDNQNVVGELPDDYDLDNAVGVQLDRVGLWVGVSRRIATPLSGVYFSFGIVGLGFGQGVWRGPFDPATGIVNLDDETYRLLLRAKIGANHWDGTLAGSKAILANIFQTGTPGGELYDSGGYGAGPYGGAEGSGTFIFIDDHQDMSMTVGVSGNIPSALFLALLTGGYIPIKPAGVRANYEITSVDGAPLFGFGAQNPYIAGFGIGAWGTAI